MWSILFSAIFKWAVVIYFVILLFDGSENIASVH